MAEKKASLIIEIKDMASSALDGLRNSLAAIKESALSLGVEFSALTAFVIHSITQFGEQEVAVKRLDMALKSVQGNTAGATERLKQLADSLSKSTGVTNTSIVSMQAMLGTMGFNEAAIAQLTPRILDLSKAMGVDAQSAAMALGKSIETGSNMPLKRMGIILDASTLKNRDFAGTMEQIDAKVKGAAEAFGGTALGGIAKLKSGIEDLTEKFGEALANVLNPMIQWAGQFVQYLETLDPAVLKFAAAFTLAAAAATGLLTVVGILATIFAPLTLSVLGVVTAISVLATNAGGLRTVIVDLVQVIATGFASIQLAITGHLQEAAAASSEAMDKLKSDSLKSFDAMKNGATNAYTQIKDLFSKGFGGPQGAKGGPQGSGGPGAAPNIPGVQLFDKDELAIKLANLKGYHQQAQQLTLQHELKLRGITEQSEQAQLLTRNMYNQMALQGAGQFFGNLSVLQRSKHKELQAIGKTAAVAQATVSTYLAATQAYAALAGIPIIGPALATAAAAAAIVAGMANIAEITGVSFAEGGMAMPTSGGTFGRFAEAGKPEAVIPLDDPTTKRKLADVFGGGHGITVNVGTLIADQAGLEDFARRLDKVFWRLKKNNQTVAV